MLVEQLKVARALLVEKGWTQGAYARNAVGSGLVRVGQQWFGGEPACFCTLGAIEQATGNGESTEAYYRVCEAVRNALPYSSSLASFNDADGRTVAEVLAVFDRALSRAEAA